VLPPLLAWCLHRALRTALVSLAACGPSSPHSPLDCSVSLVPRPDFPLLSNSKPRRTFCWPNGTRHLRHGTPTHTSLEAITDPTAVMPGIRKSLPPPRHGPTAAGARPGPALFADRAGGDIARPLIRASTDRPAKKNGHQASLLSYHIAGVEVEWRHAPRRAGHPPAAEGRGVTWC